MKKINVVLRNTGLIALLLLLGASSLFAHEAIKPVRNTFEGNFILDNQTVMVDKKGTLEMDIQHRFGTVNNGYTDFYGLYAPSNIRLGFSYVAVNNLQLGFGFTKERLQWDANLKYAIIRQKVQGGWPVSVTYFGNMVVDTRGKENFVTGTDRISYFSQLLIARKISNRLSLQVAPSLSYFNNIPGYLDVNGNVQPTMNNAHIAIAAMGRYKVTDGLALLVNYDQPLTAHTTNNPYSNISFGLEITTSNHSFQIFAGNYSNILAQNGNFFNQYDPSKGQFLIGFNMTRLWNL